MPDVPTMVEGFGKHGTSMLASGSSEMGDMPIKNWSGVGYRDFPMRTRSSKISDENGDENGDKNGDEYGYEKKLRRRKK